MLAHERLERGGRHARLADVERNEFPLTAQVGQDRVGHGREIRQPQPIPWQRALSQPFRARRCKARVVQTDRIQGGKLAQ